MHCFLSETPDHEFFFKGVTLNCVGDSQHKPGPVLVSKGPQQGTVEPSLCSWLWEVEERDTNLRAIIGYIVRSKPGEPDSPSNKVFEGIYLTRYLSIKRDVHTYSCTSSLP